jgi:hypothetical protein
MTPLVDRTGRPCQRRWSAWGARCPTHCPLETAVTVRHTDPRLRTVYTICAIGVLDIETCLSVTS